MSNTRVAIIGPTSYTGLELIRLLARHPHAKLTYLASHREQLPNIADEFPELRGRCDMTCQPIDPHRIAEAADVAFTCLPHVAAMQYVPELLNAGLKVVDLSADYRISDPVLYEKTYQHPHTDRANLDHAVYGLPELFPDDIPGARLIANPGCYPTAAALGIAPLLIHKLARPTGIVINAASGVTGAGRTPKANLHFPEVMEGFAAYNPGIHRHQPEIAQTLTTAAGQQAEVLFVPHLLPVNRGILETIYLEPVDSQLTEAKLNDAFAATYDGKPFIRLRHEMPNIRHVRDTNYCDIAVRFVAGRIIVFSAIDNLTKGASGQAIQNMNLIQNHEETAGLI